MSEHEVEYSMFEESLMDEIHQLHITISELEQEIDILVEQLDIEKNKTRN